MDGLVGIVPIAKTMRIFIMAQSNTRPELKVHTNTPREAHLKMCAIHPPDMYLGIVKQRCHDIQRYVDREVGEDREGRGELSTPTQSTWKYHII